MKLWVGAEFSGDIADQMRIARNFVVTEINNKIGPKEYDIEVGTSFNMWIEGNPDNEIEDITYNARPYFSLTPINNLNLRVYVDNVFLQSTGNLDQIIFGFLFAYNFSPKSWIYFALNEIHDRSDQFDSEGRLQPSRLHVQNRAAVLKIKYLYYF